MVKHDPKSVSRNPVKKSGTRLATPGEMRAFRKHLKRNPTPSEVMFADRLRSAGIQFRVQQKLGYVIADFTIPSRMLVIEIDGGYHLDDQQQWRDRQRDDLLAKVGWLTTIRLTNQEAETWPIENILNYTERPPSWYIKAQNELARHVYRECRAKGLVTRKKERRAIREMFGLGVDGQITQEQVLQYRASKKNPQA